MDDDTKNPKDKGERVKYPGPRQILRYMRLEHENRDDGTVWVRTPVLDDLRDPGGAISMGALAPMCDMASGVLANRRVSPDWVATQDFKMHLSQPVTSGFVTALCRPLRVGKNTVLSESTLTDDDGAEVGKSYVTFTRLPRRTDNPAPPPRKGIMYYHHEDEEPRLPLDEYLGLRFDPDAAAFELDHGPRIHNSFGSIQGGAMGALLERAGAYAAQRHFGQPTRSIDMHFSYTAQAKVGPFSVAAEVIRADDRGVMSRVQLVDTGLEDRVAAVGTVFSVPIA